MKQKNKKKKKLEAVKRKVSCGWVHKLFVKEWKIKRHKDNKQEEKKMIQHE